MRIQIWQIMSKRAVSVSRSTVLVLSLIVEPDISRIVDASAKMAPPLAAPAHISHIPLTPPPSNRRRRRDRQRRRYRRRRHPHRRHPLHQRPHPYP